MIKISCVRKIVLTFWTVLILNNGCVVSEFKYSQTRRYWRGKHETQLKMPTYVFRFNVGTLLNCSLFAAYHIVDIRLVERIILKGILEKNMNLILFPEHQIWVGIHGLECWLGCCLSTLRIFAGFLILFTQVLEQCFKQAMNVYFHILSNSLFINNSANWRYNMQVKSVVKYPKTQSVEFAIVGSNSEVLWSHWWSWGLRPVLVSGENVDPHIITRNTLFLG
jgi:hypothetical protein